MSKISPGPKKSSHSSKLEMKITFGKSKEVNRERERRERETYGHQDTTQTNIRAQTFTDPCTLPKDAKDALLEHV